MRDRAEWQTLLEDERASLTEMTAENAVLKSQVAVLNDEMRKLKSELEVTEVRDCQTCVSVCCAFGRNWI